MRKFTHVNEFRDGTAYILIDGDNKAYTVLNDGTKKFTRMFSLEYCVKLCDRGIYKEIPNTLLDEGKLVGTMVEYRGQDSYYKGRIVSVFSKLNGTSIRCVVENDDGLLLIKSLSNAVMLLNE